MKDDNVRLWPLVSRDPLIRYYVERIAQLQEHLRAKQQEYNETVVSFSDLYAQCLPEEYQKIVEGCNADPQGFISRYQADYEALFFLSAAKDTSGLEARKIASQANDNPLYDYYKDRISQLEGRLDQVQQEYRSLCSEYLDFYKQHKPDEYMQVWDEVMQEDSAPKPCLIPVSSRIEIKSSKTKLFLRSLSLYAERRPEICPPNHSK